MTRGIYTLANDVVYDQLIALLNSIEQNVGTELPICIIPYDDRLDRVQQEIQQRPNVNLFDSKAAIDRWETFAHQVWAAHPREKQPKSTRPKWYGGHLQRKFATFDGPFDEFVFYEADNLAMKPIEDIFERLQTYDFVFNDWEHAKATPVAALNIPLIEATGLYQEADIRPRLHCGSFFASKGGLFPPAEVAELQKRLIDDNEVTWINGNGWWDDVFLFNYLTLRCDRPLFNYTLSPDSQERTGNCADADPFVSIDNVLYNEQGLKPIHRIHYMNYSSADFARLCQGEDADIRYKDTFLHYRFLKNPEAKPTQLRPPGLFAKANRRVQKAVKKLQKTFS